MQFISLSGVDGSGKSTQLALLREHLEKEGKRVAYFHAIEFSLANRITSKWRRKDFAPGAEKAVTEASLLSVLLRQKLLFIDTLRFRFWVRHLRLEGYDILLSDRSFLDSLINIEYLSHHPLVRFGNTVLARLVPKADQAFFLRLSAPTILSRARVPEQGVKYLEQKLALFETKIPSWNLIVLNGEQAPEKVFQDLLRALK